VALPGHDVRVGIRSAAILAATPRAAPPSTWRAQARQGCQQDAGVSDCVVKSGKAIVSENGHAQAKRSDGTYSRGTIEGLELGISGFGFVWSLELRIWDFAFDRGEGVGFAACADGFLCMSVARRRAGSCARPMPSSWHDRARSIRRRRAHAGGSRRTTRSLESEIRSSKL